MTSFIKAQVNGNDFLIFEDTELSPDQIRQLADRKNGIGCDQVIIIEQRRNLKFFNSDGSSAKMCGNGTAAACLYLNASEIVVDGRIYKAQINGKSVTITFPLPRLIAPNIVDTGNLHIILPMSEIDKYKNYPDYNVHFIERISPTVIKVKTYERGAGWTLACGSGAVAICFYINSPNLLAIIHEGGTSQTQLFSNHITFHPGSTKLQVAPPGQCPAPLFP